MHFSCDEGYELQGSKSISCLRVTDSYVGWSDDRPICRGKAWHAVHLCIIYEGSPHVTPPRPWSYFYTLVHWSVCFEISRHFVYMASLSPLPNFIHYWPFYSDWPDIDLWLASFHFLLFSHASIALPISHVYLTSDHFVTGGWTVQAPYGVPDVHVLLSFSFLP